MYVFMYDGIPLRLSFISAEFHFGMVAFRHGLSSAGFASAASFRLGPLWQVRLFVVSLRPLALRFASLQLGWLLCRVCCLRPPAYFPCILPSAYRTLHIFLHQLPACCCLLPVAYCLLPRACCLLSIAQLLLPIACSLTFDAYSYRLLPVKRNLLKWNRRINELAEVELASSKIPQK